LQVKGHRGRKEDMGGKMEKIFKQEIPAERYGEF